MAFTEQLLEVINMEWPMIIIVILAILLFIKIISKLVKVVIGVVIVAFIAYYLLGIDLQWLSFN